jgi:hypothetical protein
MLRTRMAKEHPALSTNSCFVTLAKGTLTTPHKDCAYTSICKIEATHSGLCTVLLSSFLFWRNKFLSTEPPLQKCLSNPLLSFFTVTLAQGHDRKMPLRERARLAHRARISAHAAHVLDVWLNGTVDCEFMQLTISRNQINGRRWSGAWRSG